MMPRFKKGLWRSGFNPEKLMDVFEGVVLGVVQGLTEFLPVSSSGHLVLAEHLLGFNPPGIRMEVALHAGTLVAVLVFYRSRILDLVRLFFNGDGDAMRYTGALVVGSIPAGIVYFFWGRAIERVFERTAFSIWMLACTGIALITLLFANRDGKAVGMNWFRSLAVGFAQAIALLPGISRSGATIVAGRHLGLSPDAAAEFSFLLSIPAVAGATLVKFAEARVEGDDVSLSVLLLAGVVSGAVGYVAIAWLMRLLRAGRLWLFGVYCLAVSAIALAVVLSVGVR